MKTKNNQKQTSKIKAKISILATFFASLESKQRKILIKAFIKKCEGLA